MDTGVLHQMEEFDHEEVVFFQNKALGLKAIVAIHDTTLGPALGGTRLWDYASEEEALKDVLRLSRGMTYKAAAAGLNLGGGKAVIIGVPSIKSQALFRAYGRFIDSLNGRYISAEDVNINVVDVEYMYMETDYVVGIDESHGGSGDPSPFTALGVFEGIKASMRKVFGCEEFKGRRVAVQGVGSVGSSLVKLLSKAGADIVVTDIDAEKVEKIKDEFSVETVSPDEIYSVECDIYAPCALGAVINDSTVGELKCKIVAGAANNQLLRLEHAKMLRERGILYTPDYVINAGGLINVYLELEGYSRQRATRMVRNIYNSVMRVFKIADDLGYTTAEAANFYVEKRLSEVRKSAHIFRQHHKSILKNIHHRGYALG